MVNDSLTQQVRIRAKNRCEYCKMHQSLQGATFHVEHILPRVLGGQTELDNLAWACPSCNLHKSDRTSLRDMHDLNQPISLFNPRKDIWSEHFSWDGFVIVGLTPMGAALVTAFELNCDRKIRIRKAEKLFNLFPAIE